MSEDNTLVKNAADESQVKKSKRVERSERDKELDDLRFVLSSPQGRRFMWRLLEKCNIFADVVTVDEAETNRFLGSRRIGLYVLSEVNIAKPYRWIQMQQENGGQDIEK